MFDRRLTSGGSPEIESLNLSDIDVSALEVRLELSTIIPNWMPCTGYCSTMCTMNCTCYNVDGCAVHCNGNTGCDCNALEV